jgi:hypothetical protein
MEIMNRVINTIFLGLSTLRNYYSPKKFYHSILPLELRKELWNHLNFETRKSILRNHPYNIGWRLHSFLWNTWVIGLQLFIGVTPSIFYFIKDKYTAGLVFIICFGYGVTSLLFNPNHNILEFCVNLFGNTGYYDHGYDYIDYDNKLHGIKNNKEKYSFSKTCF